MAETARLSARREQTLAVPGELNGLPTKIDHMLSRADCLVGQVLNAIEKFPRFYNKLEICSFLLCCSYGGEEINKGLGTGQERAPAASG
ncbi:hypothetical protein EV424DRAFT_1414176 [Suillus variegatus]|nr:hypothetical protein EV424DRAFT_1414176 [Suillus variegatus]